MGTAILQIWRENDGRNSEMAAWMRCVYKDTSKSGGGARLGPRFSRVVHERNSFTWLILTALCLLSVEVGSL